MNTTKTPLTNTHVKLIGENGNALNLLAKTKYAMKRDGVDPHIIDEFANDATSGDYDHLLQTINKYVHVE